MGCHICSRSASTRSPLYCPSCARSYLYLLRYENARVLLEKESIGQEIEVSVAGDPEANHVDDKLAIAAHERSLRWTIQAIQTEHAQMSSRAKSIRACADALKAEIQQKTADANSLRSNLRQRRSDAESAKFQLSDRRHLALSNIQNAIKRNEHLWHSLHTKTAESRIFLCREAAKLYRLQQKVRRKDNTIIESYWIGGTPIIDLRDLNGAMPSQISTSFSNVAHLLVLVSHYLSLRLPAEIVLPHRNYATPMIFTPAASYTTREVMTPEYKPWYPGGNPTPSKTPDVRKHRPRPLSVEKTLPRLMKEEPATYALFIEGASLLAWNVSWLCRTQGLQVGSDTWETVCNTGKSLYQLLVSPPTQHLHAIRAVSNHDLQSKLRIDSKSPKTTIQRTKSFPIFGHYSHGTSHSFLGTAEGMEFVKSWKLPTPTKLADKLKSALMGEMANAEWELLEETEWDETAEIDHPSQSPVPTSLTTEINYHESTEVQETSKDIVDKVEDKNTEPAKDRNSNRPKGTSGWMKLKIR
ncbi:UV radiation resistance protein and autophagy-related subunit 14-domain-containing protein [Talaromyces proteolyticus]|uniref:Autophagy-related protein 14 n=1 Tax=Talaromyces proteolyticus TaxID=1131652 RepID=A0AAD4KZU7_9EURO|nr:UV radiation resistance protein and autophagy-related subunit 14-domain-containing protein [Talaromyces proteolyticus]KAH8701156.1 UV radiation resistance protein and autophagy-related subunit 14-domain-containing protein [Talaromyces proteolyticus]